MKNIILAIGLFALVSCSTTKNIDTIDRDGSSPEKAIKVSSVSEEYKYARKVCPDCRLMGQALIFHKRKPYDLLNFVNSEGKEVSYYFDISKFYGKW